MVRVPLACESIVVELRIRLTEHSLRKEKLVGVYFRAVCPFDDVHSVDDTRPQKERKTEDCTVKIVTYTRHNRRHKKAVVRFHFASLCAVKPCLLNPIKVDLRLAYPILSARTAIRGLVRSFHN